MKNKLNNKGGAIPYILLVILILMAIGLTVFVYYYKNYVEIESTNETMKVEITNEDKAKITNYMNSSKEIISKIMYEKKEDGTVNVILNSNILTDKNKQLYTFLYLDKEGEMQDNYVKSVKDKKEYIYLPLTNFNEVYNILFKEEFNSVNKDTSNIDDEYDKADYVYYNKDSIIEGNVIDSFTINDLLFDDTNNYYNASFNISYNGNENTNKVIVAYEEVNDNIYLKEIKIK